VETVEKSQNALFLKAFRMSLSVERPVEEVLMSGGEIFGFPHGKFYIFPLLGKNASDNC
jgi:hypothetical protein